MTPGSSLPPPPDDPLRRQRTPSPLPSPITPSGNITGSTTSSAAVSPSASPAPPYQQGQTPLTSSQPATPQRLPHLRPLRKAVSPSPVRSEHQPLIQLDGESSTKQAEEENPFLVDRNTLAPLKEEVSGAMTSDRSYGATGTHVNTHNSARRHDARPASSAAGEVFAHGSEADADGDHLTTSGGQAGPGVRRPRQLSFKKRRTLEGGRGSVYSEGPRSGSSGFLKRASMAAFGRAFPSSSLDSRSREGNMRRIHTISINGQQPTGFAEVDASGWERKPRIPSLIPAGPSSGSTPIPTLPFVVLCLVCFGEFSSAGVAGPFLFFQIDSFNVGGEGEVGYWAGVVAAVFFFAQFLTSLLWASAAQQHGRRAVLLVSLLGNSISLALFGMSTNLRLAISIRLAQGLFNGAVGVAKGAVRDLTDETNEGRAMAQLGFAWGMGGIIGPLLGGLLCNPADKFPSLFGKNEFLIQYPYVLPCLVVASFTAIGAFLTLFVGPDGGPRTGAIHLPEKSDVERAATKATSTMGSFGRAAGKHISGYFGAAGQGSDGRPSGTPAGESLVSLRTDVGPSGNAAPVSAGLERTFTQQVDDETGGPPSPHESDDEGTIITNRAGASGFDHMRKPYFARPRPMSRTTARQRSVLGGGSAYGYDVAPSLRQEQAGSGFAHVRNSTQPTASQNRASVLSTTQYAPDFEDLGDNAGRTTTKPRQLSFAQRFLLANDDAVLGLSDLWVAAAINNDESYLDDEDDDFGYDYDDTINRDGLMEDDEEELIEDSFDGSDFDRSNARGSTGSMAFGHDEADEDSPLMPRHLPPLNFARRHRLSSAGASSRGSRPFMRRTGSGGRIPSVYSNTGVENTPLLSPGRPMSPAGRPDGSNAAAAATGGYDPTLAGIPESTSVPGTLRGKPPKSPGDRSHAQYGGANASHISAQTAQQQKAHSDSTILLQLPLAFIAHYALMSLHSSTFDQVFMAYLVTPFTSGGLGLTAAHYAELIAALAFCQIGFQFYFYPKVGPPQGQLSHLSMMRLGTFLYLPVYVLFAYLRAFLHPSTDVLVMSFMILFASLRLLANVCAFTSVSILMNATTAPHLVPLANGLAQTTSSAARFVGPLVGGMLWAKGVEGGYETHAWPFNYHLGFWVAGLLGFTGFLHSWLIR